jgi:PIN domain nuclease of toxin-antitoxin system
MNTTYSNFAATLAEIRVELTDLAFDKDKVDRTVIMRAAAAIAMFESDTLRKAAGPILPGEFQA